MTYQLAPGKQRWIAHRGNLDGPNPELENRPDYILAALARGHEVEIDVRFDHEVGQWFLGHDFQQYRVTFEFLLHPNLWLHAKSLETLLCLRSMQVTRPNLHFFWHENDQATLTSLGYIWTFTYPPSLVESPYRIPPELMVIVDHAASLAMESQPCSICSDFEIIF